MTLFVDDMTFSGKKPIPHHLTTLVERELNRVELRLKPSKIKNYDIDEFKCITGVMLSPKHDLKVPNKRREVVIEQLKQERGMNEKAPLSNSLKSRITTERTIESAFLSTVK